MITMQEFVENVFKIIMCENKQITKQGYSIFRRSYASFFATEVSVVKMFLLQSIHTIYYSSEASWNFSTSISLCIKI